ncbi:hypothetical protein PSACC_02859 [Paramicrosporidium saccamoebae]|uniref:Uncharacterized protein n=1 Tax=Paramicrosporidium saccamoebae TaxID=1246581 RepID=A0A2H9THY8_9FUNG|nr:hypothetical protein PSACC_02859 [Paramicrosporidium saccamoebae]
MLAVVVLLALVPIVACNGKAKKDLLQKLGSVCSEQCAPRILFHAGFEGKVLPKVHNGPRGTAFHCALLKAMLINPEVEVPFSESVVWDTAYLNEFFLTKGNPGTEFLTPNWDDFTELGPYEERLKLLPAPISDIIVRHEKKYGLRRSLDLFHITDLESFIYWAPCFLETDIINETTKPKDFVELDRFFNGDTTLSQFLLTKGAFKNFVFPTIRVGDALPEHESIYVDDSKDMANKPETNDESAMETVEQQDISPPCDMQQSLDNNGLELEMDISKARKEMTTTTPPASPSIAIMQKKKSTDMFVEERSQLLDHHRASAKPMEVIDPARLVKEPLLDRNVSETNLLIEELLLVHISATARPLVGYSFSAQIASAINLLVVQAYASRVLRYSVPTRYIDPCQSLHDIGNLRHTVQEMHFSKRHTEGIKAAIGNYILAKAQSGELSLQSGVTKLRLRNFYDADLHDSKSAKLKKLVALDCRYDLASLLGTNQNRDGDFEKALLGDFFETVQFLGKNPIDGSKRSLVRLSVLYEYLAANPSSKASRMLQSLSHHSENEVPIDLVCKALLPIIETLDSEEELKVFLKQYVLSIILVANGYDRVLQYQVQNDERSEFLFHKHQAVLEQVRILATVPTKLLAMNEKLNDRFTNLFDSLLEKISDPTTIRNLLNSFLYELKDNMEIDLDLTRFNRGWADNVNNYMDQAR